MKFFILISIILSIPFIGCKKYKRTVDLGNGLYVEVFNVNPAGVDRVYLTDSQSFRLNVDRYDNEHETISYTRVKDGVYIMKSTPTNKNCHWVVLDNGVKNYRCDLDTIYRKTYNI